VCAQRVNGKHGLPTFTARARAGARAQGTSHLLPTR